MHIVVRPFISSSSAACTARSDSVSSALVASSRNKDRRVFQDGPGDGNPLALAAGKRHPFFADDRVETFGLLRNEFTGVGMGRSGGNLV